ncbi:acetyl-CoA synthetase-like protein [Apiospora saccharicola]|uniref:Acetyl-CoA synthetase-like protein n=1 Tax=Apiospora saccharicola TaxID=335842 RepID=A0ABR1TH97_9PEZI
MSTVLSVSPVEIDQAADTTTFVKLGGDLLSAILISAECEKKGISVPACVFLRTASVKVILNEITSVAKPITIPLKTTSLVTSPTILEETNHNAASSRKDGTFTVKDLLARTNVDEWTELQLFLLRETAQNRYQNILTLYRNYSDSYQVEGVCKAWEDKIIAEPIFQNLLEDMGNVRSVFQCTLISFYCKGAEED